MDGTVTISLETYEVLKAQADIGRKEKEYTLRATKELEVFLSFVSTRPGMTDHIDEFNTHSKTCKIRMVDERAKIELLKLTQDEED